MPCTALSANEFPKTAAAGVTNPVRNTPASALRAASTEAIGVNVLSVDGMQHRACQYAAAAAAAAVPAASGRADRDIGT